MRRRGITQSLQTASVARVIALVLPLGLDTFAIAAALGMTRLTGAQRIRISLLFAAFEGGMPVVGLLIGVGLGQVVGGWSEYIAIVALVRARAAAHALGDLAAQILPQGGAHIEARVDQQ